MGKTPSSSARRASLRRPQALNPSLPSRDRRRSGHPPAYYPRMPTRGRFTLLTIRGIPVGVDWSWFFVLFLII